MKPIIMGAESVMAVLDGRKTMTRRVDKINQNFWPEVGLDQDGKLFDVGYGDFQDKCHIEHLCPYGKIGDRLWVRETWSTLTYHEGDVPIHVVKDNKNIKHDVVYYAECPDFSWIDGDGFQEYRKDGMEASHWKSPLYMPRWASRITLEITDIRVERLQDITEDDAIAEGCSNRGVKFLNTLVYPPAYESVPIAEYANIWQKLNAKRGYPWESNPWVWVISFKRVKE